MAAALHLRKSLRIRCTEAGTSRTPSRSRKCDCRIAPIPDQRSVGSVAEDVVDVEEHRVAAGQGRSNGRSREWPSEDARKGRASAEILPIFEDLLLPCNCKIIECRPAGREEVPKFLRRSTRRHRDRRTGNRGGRICSSRSHSRARFRSRRSG
jgi:hypothetical protein